MKTIKNNHNNTIEATEKIEAIIENDLFAYFRIVLQILVILIINYFIYI